MTLLIEPMSSKYARALYDTDVSVLYKLGGHNVPDPNGSYKLQCVSYLVDDNSAHHGEQALLISFQRSASDESVGVRLPKGTKLIIDRIYIRKGNEEYDSVTLRMPIEKEVFPKAKELKMKSARFWVKLDDFNNIEYE